MASGITRALKVGQLAAFCAGQTGIAIELVASLFIRIRNINSNVASGIYINRSFESPFQR